MYLVQLLLPLYDNAGRRVSHEQFAQVRDELTEAFGGVTAYMRSPAQGTWKPEGGRIDRDEVVMCEVVVERLDRAWWTRYRSQLEDRFDQQELMVRATAVERL
jgi:hypothetical protein